MLGTMGKKWSKQIIHKKFVNLQNVEEMSL